MLAKPSVHEQLRQRMLSRLGLGPQPKRAPTYEELRKSEWCTEFEELMRNRLIMGAMRYAPINALISG